MITLINKPWRQTREFDAYSDAYCDLIIRARNIPLSQRLTLPLLAIFLFGMLAISTLFLMVLVPQQVVLLIFIPAVILIIWLLLLVRASLLRERLRRYVRKKLHLVCGKCRYPLAQIPRDAGFARCPECGAGNDMRECDPEPDPVGV
jgi:LSD1 subclass zinc finger protein